MLAPDALAVLVDVFGALCRYRKRMQQTKGFIELREFEQVPEFVVGEVVN